MKYLFLFLTIVLLISCGQDASKQTKGTDTVSTAAHQVPVANDNYFSLLKGSIGEYPVTLYLFALQHQYSGYYYYDSRQMPIYFTGNDTSSAGAIILAPYGSNDDITETFRLSFDGQKASGTWQKGSKSLPVSLVQTNMSLSFSYVGFTDSARLTDTLPHSPVATAEASSVWPKDNTTAGAFVKQQIALLFEDKHPQADVKSMLRANVKAFLEDYKSDSSGITPQDVQDFPESLNYALNNDLRIVYQTANLLALSFNNYSYTGGAHGNFGTAYRLLDLQHNKVVNFKDILIPEGMRQLRPLLESNYRQMEHLQPSQSLSKDGNLFEDKIEPNNNFYVTGKGLIFSYTPYEIAPYAVGEITIMIPFQQLQNYLQPTFSSILN